MVKCPFFLRSEKEEQHQHFSLWMFFVCVEDQILENACDRCKEWYHAECVKGCLNDFKKSRWLCSKCTEL